jgi:hypothetical protein
MIKLDKASFIATSAETQTQNKVSKLVVNYNNYLGTKEVDGVQVTQGYIQSFVYNDTMNSILTNTQENTLFTGDILNELTNQYIAILQDLNPTVIFTNTL